MSSLSAERKTRLLRKSASQQYLFAKRLSSEERTQLEQALEQRIRQAPTQERANEALTMWMSVQQARLRRHDLAHRIQHANNQADAVGLGIWGVTIPMVPFVLRSARREYYNSPIRPEYEVAFDNFMHIIGDTELALGFRETAARRLEYHWRSEKTIAPRQAELLRARGGAMALALSGYRMATDTNPRPLTATERAAVYRRIGSYPNVGVPNVGVARPAGAQAQRAATAGGPALPPKVLYDAMDMLTGFHEVGVDEVDMRELTEGYNLNVIDHLQDLSEKSQDELDPRVWLAFVEADEDPKQLITKLLALVAEDPPVLSPRQH